MLVSRLRLPRVCHPVLVALASGLLVVPAAATAQDEPFVVHDTKSVITHGPYLVEPTETAVTVVWTTDTPAHARVELGETDTLDRVFEPVAHGLVPVGTVHHVRLTGLEPGRTYHYRVVATRVVKLKAYWPEKGLPVETPIFTFRTLDRGASTVSFSLITDTHEDVARIKALAARVDWPATDFFVHLGDAFHWLAGEDQLFERWLDPTIAALDHRTPLVFARGNHEMRGAFARALFDYLPVSTGEFYYAFDDGPVHLVVLDSGEDKDDDTNVYARLNKVEPYRERELAWWRDHVATAPRAREAPFQVVLVHQPDFGYVGGENQRWVDLANRARVDLVIAGHRHRFSRVAPGEQGNDYTILVLGQDQLARVDATADELRVTVVDKDGAAVDAFVLHRRDR